MDNFGKSRGGEQNLKHKRGWNAKLEVVESFSILYRSLVY